MGSGPQMANREYVVALLYRGVSFWNEWRKDKDGRTIDLSGVDLRNRDLTGADLRAVNLSNAVLRGPGLARVHSFGTPILAAPISTRPTFVAPTCRTSISTMPI